MANGSLVVGSITADVTAFAQRLPRAGETVLGDDVSLVLGGKGANQAVASAHFGAPTWMVGCIGTDAFGRVASDGLAAHSVRSDFVRSVDGRTGVAHIRVDASGQNDIVITPLANTSLSTADVDHALTELDGQVGVMMLQLEVPADITAYAAACGARAGLTVILDPAPAVDVPESIWSAVSIVTPNESEAAAITGVPVSDEASARDAAAWFLDHGTRHVVITLGGAGALYVSATESRFFPALTVDVVDTTAAGDAFTGTLGAALASGLDIPEAMTFSIAAGALAVTRPGASPSLPYRDQIVTLVNDHRPQGSN
jgi:ribokinase